MGFYWGKGVVLISFDPQISSNLPLLKNSQKCDEFLRIQSFEYPRGYATSLAHLLYLSHWLSKHRHRLLRYMSVLSSPFIYDVYPID